MSATVKVGLVESGLRVVQVREELQARLDDTRRAAGSPSASAA